MQICRYTVCVYTSVLACKCTLKWNPDGSLAHCSSGATYFGFLFVLKQGPSLGGLLDWPAGLRDPPVFSSTPLLGLQAYDTMPWFLNMGSGNGTQVFVLAKQVRY